MKLQILAALFFFSLALQNLFSQTTASAGEALEAFFTKCEKNGWSGSVSVMAGGKVLLEKGYGWQDREAKKRQSAETVFSVGSITKQFTGAAILKLQMAGKLSVQDRLGKYIPGLPAEKADITLHQLLTHTAGCPDALGDDYEQIDAAAFLERFAKEPLVFAPGTEHQYSNVGYSLLGILVEKISGQGYEAYLYEQLWKPAGMEKTGYLRPGHQAAVLAVGYRNGNRWGTALDRPWMSDGPGWHLRANGGVLSTVGDMSRWFEALQGEKVLDKAAKEQYFKAHAKECPDCMSFYGYGWVVDRTPDEQRLIWHNGGNGVYNAYMGFVPATGTCIVISSNSNDKIADAYSLKVLDILAGASGPGLSPEVSDRYSGVYKLPSGSSVRIWFDELDKLRAEWTDADALLVLSGDGSEEPEKLEPLLQKAQQFAQDGHAGKYEMVAQSMGAPLEEAKAQTLDFWNNLESNYGKVKTIQVLGAVARPMRKAALVFLRLEMERGTRFMTQVWQEERFQDIRMGDKMEKEFEMDGPMRFFSPNNKLSAMLLSDGNISLERGGKRLAILKK